MLIPGRYCCARVTTPASRFVDIFNAFLLITFAQQKEHRQPSPSHEEEDVRARAANEDGFIFVVLAAANILCVEILNFEVFGGEVKI